MTALARRFVQAAVALVLGSAVVLITQWAYPAGHLAIHVGRPQYSRMIGASGVDVSIDLRLQNVGVDAVRIDGQHFLLADDRGRIYRTDPSTHFLRDHLTDFAVILPLYHVDGTTVFRIPASRTAATLLYVTETGEIVRIRLR